MNHQGRNSFYYRIKPLIPYSVRLAIRRWYFAAKRPSVSGVWPIFPGSEQPPQNWCGWPKGKQFSFVLTHDVEGERGLQNCRELAALEKRLGFRSSFNFIPEGTYNVPAELREDLTRDGFEIGVHDLKHDGKLFSSPDSFRQQSGRINWYLNEWGAKGFRSGFMLGELGWMHDLDIEYDASTFDTDPFEPNPNGVKTIFPFWVEDKENKRANGERNHGFVGLPYTLPQDSTLFLLLQEKDISLWMEKLNWIAKNGGMALVNTHPDYMNFTSTRFGTRQFPVSIYEEFLKAVKAKFEGVYWHALPREVASYAQENKERLEVRTEKVLPGDSTQGTGKKIWIDLENTPHIPFFKPIIEELEKRGYKVVLTARDAYQTCEMADKYGFTYSKIGRHYGKNRFMKFGGFLTRSMQLLPFAKREQPRLSLNHGSRTQTLLSNLLGIPTVTIMDYEHTAYMPMAKPMYEIVPDVVTDQNVHAQSREGIRKYSGIKEDVYVPFFKPDPSLIEKLGLDRKNIIVTVRPPATEAHYHNPEAEILFEAFMKRMVANPSAQAVLLPRNKAQETQIRSNWPDWFQNNKVIIPKGVVDGLNLLWNSDLVVSGGGTMNREAAGLGVPVYSIFRGKIGAVDRQLETEGRLILVTNVEEVNSKIALQRREKDSAAGFKPRKALMDILSHIESIYALHNAK